MLTVREAFALGFEREAAGKPAEARAIYEQILAAIPDHAGALLKIAESEYRDGQFERSRELLERAVRSADAQGLPAGEIWLALGRAHIARHDLDAAQGAFERARDLECRTRELFHSLAWLALQRGDTESARTLCGAGLAVSPNDASLLHLLGNACKACGLLEEARSVLLDGAAASPNNPSILVSLGAVCLDLGLAGEARSHLERAIEGGEHSATAWDNLGLAFMQMGDFDEAARAFERAVAIDPKLTPALSNLLNALRHACRWDEAEVREREWLSGLDDSTRDPRWNPFLALSLRTTPARQLVIARKWSRYALPAAQAPAFIGTRGTRLRVGYLSSDFRQHPMSMLIVRHLEYHDRSRFEIFGYSHGAEDDSPIRRRVKSAFDHWIEARAMSDSAMAQRIRGDAIDVLVDLNGHTHGDRLGVLAQRPARVQLHYLGFPGTLGFDGIDGNIADAIVAPPEEDRYAHERVLRMPRCYFVTDGERMPPAAMEREAVGFAEESLVLVCFNQAYKLTRLFFEVWMDVLAQVPDALLWLYVPAPQACANLRSEAARCGIDPSRIRFAPRVPQDEHLARLSCADLALDTLPYCSHTTGCDALWAGVPMLSCRGTTFAGRVGESVLNAVGLPELVTDSLDAYRAQLQSLARDRERLRDYKAYLLRERKRLPLFDTEGFTRDFEALLCAAYEAQA